MLLDNSSPTFVTSSNNIFVRSTTALPAAVAIIPGLGITPDATDAPPLIPIATSNIKKT